MCREVGREAVGEFLESAGLGGEEWSYTVTSVGPLTHYCSILLPRVN